MPEGRPPISSARIATGDIARHSFAVVRRGFDPDEVRAYLQSVARSIEALEEREQELRTALAEAEERAAHPVIDEATLTASLGQHSAQILRHAHDEAARIVAQAQERAATLLRETQSQVDELQARTEAAQAERVVEVELLVANAQHEARVESERIVAAALARGRGADRPCQGRGARPARAGPRGAPARAGRPGGATPALSGIQIEQLRAARDEMAASVHGVRDRVDGILAHLDRTDERGTRRGARRGRPVPPARRARGRRPRAGEDEVEEHPARTDARRARRRVPRAASVEDDGGGGRRCPPSTSCSPVSAPGPTTPRRRAEVAGRRRLSVEPSRSPSPEADDHSRRRAPHRGPGPRRAARPRAVAEAEAARRARRRLIAPP